MNNELILNTINIRKQIAEQFPINSHFSKQLKYGQTTMDYGTMFIHYINSEFVAEKMETKTFDTSYTVHKNWFEQLKDTVLPHWLKKYIKPKFKNIKRNIDFTAWEVYPKFPAVDKDKWSDGHFKLIY